MPNPAPSPTGTCPKCKRTDVKLMTNKFDADHPRTCPRCYNTAWAADKAKRTGAANVKRAATKATKMAVAAKAAPVPSATKRPAKAAKELAAPKEPRPEPIAQPRPASAPTSRTFVPLTARLLADALFDEQVIALQVEITKVSEMLAILRAVEDDHSVLIAVGLGVKG